MLSANKGVKNSVLSESIEAQTITASHRGRAISKVFVELLLHKLSKNQNASKRRRRTNSKLGVDANDPPLMVKLLPPIKNNVRNNPCELNL